MQKFISKYPEICSISLLVILCIIFLFFGIDFYPIMDSYESLYAVIAKNLLVQDDLKVLILNMKPFLDNPPLYFWIISKSIKLMAAFNEISVRIPNTILSTILVFTTYYMGKHTISRKFGLVSAIILLTSFAFLIFSHVAVITIALTVFITIALYAGFLTSVADEKYRKYYWWTFYLFTAIAVLIKGALGIVLPFTIVFIYYCYLKRLKEVYKPVNFIVGLLIFIPITVPWYVEMTQLFGMKFLNNHFFFPDMKSFITNIFYYICVFLIAFMPWIFIFIGAVYDNVSKFISRFKNNAKLNAITVEQKTSLFWAISLTITAIAIATLPNKNLTFILLTIQPAALLTGYFLCADDVNEFFRQKITAISTHILAIIFTVGTISFAFIYMLLPVNIFEQVQQFKNFLIIGLNFLSILMLLKLKNKNVLSTISTYVFSMFFIIIFTVVHVFNMFYYSGEDELVRFSQFTSGKNSRLITFNIAVKPSVLINSTDFVYFIETPDIDNFNKVLEENKQYVNFIIFKNKDFLKYSNKINKHLFLIENGDKYSLYSSIELPKKAISINKFYTSD